MDSAGDKFFHSILSTLSKKDILQHFMIIGGWCQRLYRHYFNNPPLISALRTADIDFLVLNPKGIKKTDIAHVFATLGFDEVYSMPEGYVKYVNPDLEIELLVPAIGRPGNRPYPLKNLNSNAQQLSYLDIMKKHPYEITFYDLKVIVPQPAAFIINKLITSKRRKDKFKRKKDFDTAKEFSDFFLDDSTQRLLLQSIFHELPPRLQRSVSS